MANEKKTPEQVKYQKLVKERMPKSRTLSQCIRAFISGGIICCIGQLMRNWAQQGMGLDEKGTAAFTAMVMVFLGATLTGIGVYDKIGEWSGAGSIVPITGFANSIVSPAMEFKRRRSPPSRQSTPPLWRFTLSIAPLNGLAQVP